MNKDCKECNGSGCRCGGIGLNCNACCPCNADKCKRMTISFTCPNLIEVGDDATCGGHIIEERATCDEVVSTVKQLHKNGEVAEYGHPILEGDIHTILYQCATCGYKIAEDPVDLMNYLQEKNMVTWI